MSSFALVLFRYLTPWGRQFWRITGGYFTGLKSIRVWLMFGVLLFSVVLAVRLNVLFSYQGNDMYTALQKAFQGAAGDNDVVKNSGVHGFWMSIGIFSVMAVIHVARVMADIYLTQRFIVAWRVWLTDHLTGDWLDGRAYYRDLFIDETIDNPDQRIQQDIDIFTAGTGNGPNQPGSGTGNILLFGAVQSVISVVSFTAILWNLSGPLTFFGVSFPPRDVLDRSGLRAGRHGHLVLIGRPLIRLSFRNESSMPLSATRWCGCAMPPRPSASTAASGPNAPSCASVLRPIIDNYLKYVNRSVAFYGWNLTVSQAIVPLPWVIQAPRLFAGQIDFGDVSQSSSSFGNIS